MCGIAGFLNLDSRPASEVILKKMTDRIKHRGPDGEGQFTDGCVALGHRRLAIIDLSPAGHQPMLSLDKRFVITYNGEVYNFKELKLELESIGYQFHSKTDTEVMLNAYLAWGSECVRKFNGMFAFVIWDKVEQKLFLARDRYGIKPLYYSSQNGAFLFASENKAFDEFPGFTRSIDKASFVEYMTFQNFMGEKTLFKDINVFPPGHWGEIGLKDKKLKLHQYWDFHFQSPENTLSEEEYVEELDYYVRQAVNRQLVSDVEIGSFLSGGMDSGSITALAAQQLPYIKTFTIGFDLNSASGLELAFDERIKAEHMSYLFKTEHYEMVLKSGDMERCLEKVVHHIEEPRVGQSYPNYYASKLASKFTKVALSGCGGDEIFAGYPWRYYRSAGFKSFEEYVDDYYKYWQRLTPSHLSEKLFQPIHHDVKSISTKEMFKDVFKKHQNKLDKPEDYINHSLYFEAKTFLHGLLIVEDKLSMANSLETRVPFLDNDLVDLGQRIPLGLKLSNIGQLNSRVNENDINKQKIDNARTRDGKMILRKVMGKYIPESITGGEKQGFSAPDASWFKGESLNFTRKILLNKNARIYNFVDYQTVTDQLDLHLNGKENKRLLIWSLLYLETILSKL